MILVSKMPNLFRKVDFHFQLESIVQDQNSTQLALLLKSQTFKQLFSDMSHSDRYSLMNEVLFRNRSIPSDSAHFGGKAVKNIVTQNTMVQ